MMNERDMMILLLALCRLTGTETDASATQKALKKARIEVDLLEKGQNPFGHNR
jgi:hypothetical protein